MVEHVEIHIEGLSFPCPTCSRTVKTRNALRKHKQIHHQEKENNAPNNDWKKLDNVPRESQSIKFKHGTTPRSERYTKRNEKIEKANEAKERIKFCTRRSKGDKESSQTSERGFRTACGELTDNDWKGEKWSKGETEVRNPSVVRDLGDQFDVDFKPKDVTKQSSSFIHGLNMSLSPVLKFYTPRQDDGARVSLSSSELEFGTPRGWEDPGESGARTSPSSSKPDFLAPQGGEDSSRNGAGGRKPSIVKVLALQFEDEIENSENELKEKNLESNIENCTANLESSGSEDGGSEEEEETEESDDQIEEIPYGFRCAFVTCDFLVNNLQELGRHQMTLHGIRLKKDLFFHIEVSELGTRGAVLHHSAETVLCFGPVCLPQLFLLYCAVVIK